ncbi:Putative thioredoxin [Sulfurovum sp. enrichment culture clone C5]|uniref:Putative thioredoxin n=1 Tax=Sulfurovum sp. enrichment culture clone C5 TaxID=497650 RepID=A0A0S4XN83_9BACT|nr:Putative thioredoxin [Sulfurovum sp. enrichment culture clone C5]
MKYIKFLFLTFLMLFMVSCSEEKSSDNQDIATNQSGKITILFLTQDGCGSCDALKDTFKKAEVKKILDSDFEVKFIEVADMDTLPKGLMEPYGTPTLYFMSPDGKEIHDPLVGPLEKGDMVELLNQVINSFKASSK